LLPFVLFSLLPFFSYTFYRLIEKGEDTGIDDGNSSWPSMYAFCLPGHEFLLTTSTACLCSAMSFNMTEIGSYPLGSYKLAFVDEIPTQRFDSSTFPLLTVDLLHAEDAIEQPLKTLHALSHAWQAAAQAAEGGTQNRRRRWGWWIWGFDWRRRRRRASGIIGR
jgi:hypothetical protein